MRSYTGVTRARLSQSRERTSRTGRSAGQMMPKAARARSVSFRARAPHSLRVQVCLENTTLYMSRNFAVCLSRTRGHLSRQCYCNSDARKSRLALPKYLNGAALQHARELEMALFANQFQESSRRIMSSENERCISISAFRYARLFAFGNCEGDNHQTYSTKSLDSTSSNIHPLCRGGKTIKSIDEYGLFLKASSSIVGPADGVRLPPLDRRVDHEVELVAIIGKEGYRIPRARALAHVGAYAIGLDMTVRGPEDRSWRKSFETFAVIGPWLVTADEIPDPGHLDLRLTVNGSLRQSANTSALIFDVPRLVEYASSTYTLYPGDVIMTGTPEGVGAVAGGDVLECFIEKIGTMRVPIHGA